MDTVIITGPVHGGKTGFALALAGVIKLKGFSYGGIISPGLWENGVRSGFDIIDVFTGEKTPLARVGGNSSEKFRQFSFYRSGLEFGFNAVGAALVRGDDYIFIDEVGKMETEGGGWSKLISAVVSSSSKGLFAVRRDYLKEVVKTFSINNPVILDIGTPMEKALREIGL